MKKKLSVFICFLAFGIQGLECAQQAKTEKPREIAIDIKINCPMSPELKNFVKSIPNKQSPNFEDWKTSFVHNMNQLIRLVESGKVNEGTWSVNSNVSLEEAQKK